MEFLKVRLERTRVWTLNRKNPLVWYAKWLIGAPCQVLKIKTNRIKALELTRRPFWKVSGTRNSTKIDMMTYQTLISKMTKMLGWFKEMMLNHVLSTLRMSTKLTGTFSCRSYSFGHAFWPLYKFALTGSNNGSGHHQLLLIACLVLT